MGGTSPDGGFALPGKTKLFQVGFYLLTTDAQAVIVGRMFIDPSLVIHYGLSDSLL